MSVRVNLLPQATRERGRAAHARNLLISAGVFLLVVLAMVYGWAAGQVSDARVELAAEQQRTTALQGEVAELSEFAELATDREQADLLLTEAMAPEVSMAGVLQDIAAVTPSDAQLETLTVDAEVAASVDEAETSRPRTTGTVNMTGRTLTAQAPGVEQFLLELERIDAFRDLYLNNSALDDPADRVASFSLDGNLGPEAETQRYGTGLPEVLR